MSISRKKIIYEKATLYVGALLPAVRFLDAYSFDLTKATNNLCASLCDIHQSARQRLIILTVFIQMIGTR